MSVLQEKGSNVPQEETLNRGIPLTLPPNNSFIEELDTCLIPETLNNESAESVGVIVEGFGFEDVVISGLNSMKFIAYFKNEENY